MKITGFNRFLVSSLIFGGVCLFQACTSSDEKKESEEVVVDDGSGKQAETSDDGADDTARGKAQSGEEMSDTDKMMKAVEEAGSGDATGLEPEAQAETEAAAAPTNAAPASSATPPSADAHAESSRRVWYVKSKTAAVFETAQVGSKELRKIRKGEPVLISVQGDWGRIDDHQWIKMSDLVKEPISRERKGGKWDGSVK